jgi:hypothetical protein
MDYGFMSSRLTLSFLSGWHVDCAANPVLQIQFRALKQSNAEPNAMIQSCHFDSGGVTTYYYELST